MRTYNILSIDEFKTIIGKNSRLLGIDPDQVDKIARQRNDIIVVPASDKPHGWRETVVQDPDGYVWAVGEKIE